MSASACVVYFGVRYDVSEDEISSLEFGTDPRQRAAKQGGLECYWTNFGGLEERYVLLIGKKIAVLGPEDALSFSIPMERLQDIANRTASRLDEADLRGPRSLHVEWLEDV
ncbi:MAG: hypothetical protein KJZ64_04920 [Sphingomonadaceae bacterium]|nr:hypothetical protein [Sphingomonadaceae bacterium]